MTYKLPKDHLSRAVKAATACVDTKTDDVLSQIAITVSDTGVRVESCNLSAMFRADIGAPSEDGGSRVFLDPKKAAKILDKFEASCESITVSIDRNKANVVFDGGSSGKSTLQYREDRRNRTLFVGAKGEAREVRADLFQKSVLFCSKYCPPMAEFSKQFDFVAFEGPVAFSANGSNMRGFYVCKALTAVNGLKLRKQFLPFLSKTLAYATGIRVSVLEDAAVLTLSSSSDGFCLSISSPKTSNTPAPANFKYLENSGPCMRVEESELNKVLDRVLASASEKPGAPTGITMTFGESEVKVDLVSDVTEAFGSVGITRVNDEAKGTYTKTLDATVLKAITKSFSSGGSRLYYLNKDEVRYFKVLNSIEVAEEGDLPAEKVVEVAVAALSRVVQR